MSHFSIIMKMGPKRMIDTSIGSDNHLTYLLSVLDHFFLLSIKIYRMP